MSDLKHHINLSEADFKLIIDGLEALPEKGGLTAADMLMGVMEIKPSDDADSVIAKLKREKQKQQEVKRAAVDKMREDVRVLQGKIILLKRYLAEQGTLNEVHNILNNVK
ncbi:MAG TPA: hypothetical protein VK658_14790 [Chryseolinea sp.]|nr:hypothetical protein [Chryseolinea sp.]